MSPRCVSVTVTWQTVTVLIRRTLIQSFFWPFSQAARAINAPSTPHDGIIALHLLFTYPDSKINTAVAVGSFWHLNCHCSPLRNYGSRRLKNSLRFQKVHKHYSNKTDCSECCLIMMFVFQLLLLFLLYFYFQNNLRGYTLNPIMEEATLSGTNPQCSLQLYVRMQVPRMLGLPRMKTPYRHKLPLGLVVDFSSNCLSS